EDSFAAWWWEKSLLSRHGHGLAVRLAVRSQSVLVAIHEAGGHLRRWRLSLIHRWPVRPSAATSCGSRSSRRPVAAAIATGSCGVMTQEAMPAPIALC